MAKLTTAGLALIAQLQAEQNTLTIDKMIYANIAGLDPETEPPATETKPDAGNIVHESDIGAAGFVDPNTVVFSDLLDATIGDFSFNWIGLFSTANNTLIAVTYVPEQTKYATDGQNIGNTLCKNFGINYTDIKDLTGITIQADTWQLDLSTVVQDIIDENTSAKVGAYGMILSNNDIDSEHDIDISPGRIADSTNSCYIELDSVLTKQIDATWEEGNNVGGMPTGVVLAPDTWYHVFVIFKPGDDVNTPLIDGGFDTAVNAVNLLSDATGYTKYRYLGSILTDASSNILSFVQVGRYFYWGHPRLDFSGNGFSQTPILTKLSVPPGNIMRVSLSLFIDEGSGDDAVYIASPEQDAVTVNLGDPSTHIFTSVVGPGDDKRGSASYETLTNSNSQVSIQASDTSLNISIGTLGYENLAI